MKKLFLLLILLLCLPVFGQDEAYVTVNGNKISIGKGWKLISIEFNKEKTLFGIFSYKTGSVKKNEDRNSIEFKVKKQDYKAKKSEFIGYSYLSLEVKCETHQYRLPETTNYLPNGDQKSARLDYSRSFTDIKPSSIIGRISTAVCNNEGQTSKQ